MSQIETPGWAQQIAFMLIVYTTRVGRIGWVYDGGRWGRILGIG